MSSMERIKEKISKSKILEAISDLKQHVKKIGNSEIENLIVLKENEYQNLRKDQLAGIKSDEDIERRRLKISNSLLEIIIELSNKENAQNLKIGESFITSFDEVNRNFDVRKILLESERYYIVGYSFDSVLDKFRSYFSKALENGTSIKLIVINPDPAVGTASALLRKHQRTHDVIYDTKQTIKIINQIREAAGEQRENESLFQVRFTTWIPSCSLQISNPTSGNGVLRLSVYPLWVPTNHMDIRTYKVIKRRESPIVFDYLVHQFDSLWKDSIKEEAFNQNNR